MLGIKVYYKDCVRQINADQLAREWPLLPDHPLIVHVFDERTYRSGPQQTEKNIVEEFCGHGFTWLSPTSGFGQSNRARDIPDDAIAKEGLWLDKAEWLDLYNRSLQDRRWL